MRLGLGLGVEVQQRKGFDSNAAAYISRAGITDATAKANINQFVLSSKADGTWTKLFELWILRSAYNDPLQATVFGLKNAGFDGAPQASPTWSANEITFNGSTQHILISNAGYSLGIARCSITVGKGTNAGYGFIVRVLSPSGGNGLGHLFVPSSNKYVLQGFGSDIDPAWTYSSGTRQFGSFNQNGSTIGSSLNGAAFTTVAGTSIASTGNTTSIGSSGFGTNFLNGTCSMAAHFSSALTDAEISSLYTNYKATIGTGLGLP